MGFITLKPEGHYRGTKNTKQMMIDWVLEESHVINGVKIDVTQACQADDKPEEDEDRKRDDRVEERRLARVDKDSETPFR
eukprot:Skav216490  [mRNA]  locus=scaffold1123:490221:491193:- [translate_table: standard]